MNYKDADPEGSVCSQPTASQTGENFNQKKVSFARTKNFVKCPNCEQLDLQLKKTAEQIQNIEELLISFQQQIEDQNLQNKKQKQKYDELLIEMQIISEKHHQELINNGILQKQNIELRKEILKLEQNISKIQCQIYEPQQNGLFFLQNYNYYIEIQKQNSKHFINTNIFAYFCKFSIIIFIIYIRLLFLLITYFVYFQLYLEIQNQLISYLSHLNYKLPKLIKKSLKEPQNKSLLNLQSKCL